jgi:thiol-disulfide isomerase/thioredoxin
LAGISGYINTHDGFRLSEIVGKKVVLVDFWTYSCINCQRTQPYLNAWYKKYKDAGLEIVGVHTPEFAFEKDRANVVAAVEKFGITYPVVQDNDYQTWGTYGNRYWPRKYLIDIDGYIVYDHIGEGGYEETEEKIQELLRALLWSDAWSKELWIDC